MITSPLNSKLTVENIYGALLDREIISCVKISPKIPCFHNFTPIWMIMTAGDTIYYQINEYTNDSIDTNLPQ